MKLLNQRLFNNAEELYIFPHDLLAQWKSRFNGVYHAWLAHEKTTLEEVMAWRKSGKVPGAVAGAALNPNLNEGFYQWIAERGNAKALLSLSVNAAVPESVLTWMVNEDHYATMLKMIAVREKTVVDTIPESEMVKNLINTLMLNIARHKNTPLSTLRKLAAAPFNEDVRIVDALTKNATFREAGPFELMTTKFVMERRRVASDFRLSQEEIMTFWKAGVDLRCAVLKNPHLSPAVLSKLAQMTDEKGKAAIISNPSVGVELLESLSGDPSAFVRSAVALCEKVSGAILSRLSNDRNTNVVRNAAANPCADSALLNALSRRPEAFIREAVAKNKHTSGETLSALAKDSCDKVRAAVASHPSTPVLSLKILSSDKVSKVSSSVASSPSMGIITELEEHHALLKNYGQGAFNFHSLMSPKKVMKLLINSKHPSELAFIFGSGHAGAVDGLISLQSAFINERLKLNRADYLLALDKINENVAGKRRAGAAVEADYMKIFIKYLGVDLLVAVLAQYEPDEAKDCIRMAHALLSFERKEKNRENLAAILKVVESERVDFHDYLTSKTKDLWREKLNGFFQKSLLPFVPEANDLLAGGWEVNLPGNAFELAAIGDAQSHCVGGPYYAQQCAEGTNIIFQIMPRGDMRRGYTFQYARNGRLLQAKGFGNSAVPETRKSESKAVMRLFIKAMNGQIKPAQVDDCAA